MAIPVFGFADAIPVTGTWEAGTVLLRTTPGYGNEIGWRCVTSGTPGTWAVIGIHRPLFYTLAAFAALSVGAGFVYFTSNAAGTITLAPAASHAAGHRVTVQVSSANATTFAAAGSDSIKGAAAITTAASPLSFETNGVDTWYRV